MRALAEYRHSHDWNDKLVTGSSLGLGGELVVGCSAEAHDFAAIYEGAEYQAEEAQYSEPI